MAHTDTKQFIFVLDEWDFIFHRNFITNQDKEDYVSFLSNLLRDKGYVSFTYMTGILPMTAGEKVSAKVDEYAATSMNLNTKDEIFSAMVVYGFLTFENGHVSIPNKELMDKFASMLQ